MFGQHLDLISIEDLDAIKEKLPDSSKSEMSRISFPLMISRADGIVEKEVHFVKVSRPMEEGTIVRWQMLNNLLI